MITDRFRCGSLQIQIGRAKSVLSKNASLHIRETIIVNTLRTLQTSPQ